MGDDLTEHLGAVPSLEGLKKSHRMHLVVMTGPERGRVFPLEPGQFILGRSPDHSDIVLEGRGLSRAHARLMVTTGYELLLEDLGSTNGSRINGERVDRGKLKTGDSLALGEAVVKVEWTDSDVAGLIEELHQSSTSDGLTGLWNRRSFEQRLRQEWNAVGRQSSTAACVALLDIDRFKSINDTYGHAAGDAVLKGLARLLMSSLRDEDVAARWGGEEFILLLRGAELAGAGVLLDRLRETMASHLFEVPTPTGSLTIPVTVSVGAASLSPQRSPEETIAVADEALYRAKTTGRNQVCLEV
ncbi:MAG: diguanylate cyclase [Vulcanimicrobiota bacterium]